MKCAMFACVRTTGLFCLPNFTLYCRITRTLLLNQSVAKPKTLDISTSLLILFSSSGFLNQTPSSATATTYEKSSKEKSRDQAGNRMAREVSVEMSRVLGFAIGRFRSNVRVILQYSVM